MPSFGLVEPPRFTMDGLLIALVMHPLVKKRFQFSQFVRIRGVTGQIPLFPLVRFDTIQLPLGSSEVSSYDLFRISIGLRQFRPLGPVTTSHRLSIQVGVIGMGKLGMEIVDQFPLPRAATLRIG